MPNILIIKTEASGDVVRTTSIINALDADIFWITSSYNLPLFPDHHPKLKKVVAIDKIPSGFYDIEFDLILNLEESEQIALLLPFFKTNKISGVYEKDGRLTYTTESAGWFDMSLISKLGKQQADALKKKNKLTYQHYLFKMAGKEFNGEKYCIYKRNSLALSSEKITGIEQHVGERWPNKNWTGYRDLSRLLNKDGMNIMHFKRRPHLREYLDDIAGCNLMITGDTLAMHIALAYDIPCIAIFNCTSPDEIYDYSMLKKVVSPILDRVYYSTDIIPEASAAISVTEVMEHIKLVGLSHK